VPPESLLARGSWTWAGSRSALDRSPEPGKSLLRRLGKYGTPVLACGLAIGATAAEHAADRSYEKYLSAADPARIERYYSEARDRDALSTTLWVGAEVALATMIIAWIFPENSETVREAGARWDGRDSQERWAGDPTGLRSEGGTLLRRVGPGEGSGR
jgi:hypothetical protein